MAAIRFLDVKTNIIEVGGEQLSGYPELCALFRLWDGARNGRSMPARRDFTPESLRPWLGNLALIDVCHNPVRLQYRLAGIHIVENLKCDPTGKNFNDVVPDSGDNPSARGPYQCLTFGEPVFEIVFPHRKGRFSFDFARLSLPLAADGQAINMILVGEYVIPRVDERTWGAFKAASVVKVLN